MKKHTPSLLLLLALLGPSRLLAQEQILLPIVSPIPTPGANGSQWVTRLWVTNIGAQPIQIFADCSVLCPPTILQPGDSIGNPAVTLLLPTALLTGTPDTSTLQVSLRVLDLSRQATSAGTEIPAVRTTNLRTDTIHLLGIPVDYRFRYTLRVYTMASSQVTIRAKTMGNPGTTLVEMNLPIERSAAQEVPGYLQLDNFLANNTAFNDGDYFIVEVSANPAVPLWAFIAIANNDTEQVTTITPNP